MMPALHATALNIINPSFEIDILGDGVFTYGPIANWQTHSGGIFNPTTSNYASGTSIDGANLAYGNGGGAGLHQVLSDTFQPNTTYTFSMMIGRRLDTAFGGYTLELQAGNVYNAFAPIASLTGITDPGSGQWGLRTVTYTTGSTGAELGQNILVSFGSFGVQTNFDLAAGTASTVPEPSTLGLIGASLIGLAMRSRRGVRS